MRIDAPRPKEYWLASYPASLSLGVDVGPDGPAGPAPARARPARPAAGGRVVEVGRVAAGGGTSGWAAGRGGGCGRAG